MVLAEDKIVQEKLATHGIKVETVGNIDPFIIQPASVLGNMYAQLGNIMVLSTVRFKTSSQNLVASGKYEKMGLTGRPSHYVGLLSTSKLYMIDDRIFCFSPQVFMLPQSVFNHC